MNTGEGKLKRKCVAPERPAAKKPIKDPDMPKRPATSFFIFMEEFRKTFKEKNPNHKSVGKAGGGKWKSLSQAEKAPYIQQAQKRKTQYQRDMAAYTNKLARGTNTADEEEESDKSKSDDDDDDDGCVEDDYGCVEDNDDVVARGKE